MRSSHVVIFAFAAIFLSHVHGKEATTFVSVGAQQIELPNPTGQVPLRNTKTFGYQTAVQTLARLKNVLLAKFCATDVAEILDRGESEVAKEWAMAFVGEVNAFQTFSAADFRHQRELLAIKIEREITSTALLEKVNSAQGETLSDLFKEAGLDPKIVKIKVGKMYPLGIYANNEKSLTFGALSSANLSSQNVSILQPVVMVFSLVHVKGRVFSVVVYRIGSTPEDINITKNIALDWVNEIYVANVK